MMEYDDNDLATLVFERDASLPGENPARLSRLLQYLRTDKLHRDIALSDTQLRRLAAWMDTYGHTQGAFSAEQEDQLRELRRQYHYLLEETD
jgi:hypothetical protein